MHYGYYGQSPGAIAGAATAAATGARGHLDPGQFLGVNWKSVAIAVTIGSLTAILTQLTLEHVKERKKSGKVKSIALTFSHPWESK
jgi:hypothetical protein